jgi:hypothetical protein
MTAMTNRAGFRTKLVSQLNSAKVAFVEYLPPNNFFQKFMELLRSVAGPDSEGFASAKVSCSARTPDAL